MSSNESLSTYLDRRKKLTHTLTWMHTHTTHIYIHTHAHTHTRHAHTHIHRACWSIGAGFPGKKRTGTGLRVVDLCTVCVCGCVWVWGFTDT